MAICDYFSLNTEKVKLKYLKGAPFSKVVICHIQKLHLLYLKVAHINCTEFIMFLCVDSCIKNTCCADFDKESP